MRESQSMFAGLTNCAQASRSLLEVLARLEVQPFAHLIALYHGTFRSYLADKRRTTSSSTCRTKAWMKTSLRRIDIFTKE